MAKKVVLFVVALVLSLILNWGFLVTDKVRLERDEQVNSALEFGRPLNFVTQVSPYNPPLPYDVGMASAMESPVSYNWVNFGLNVTFYMVVICGIMLGIKYFMRKNSTQK